MNYHNNKTNIIRCILGLAVISFGILWQPESQATQIAQYILVGNLVLISILMEVLPLYFNYQYRHINSFLKYFAHTYEHEPLQYSYTPVVLIKTNIHNHNNPTYLTKQQQLSEKSFFTIYHEGHLYEFSTDIVVPGHVIDLASVIIYYLTHNVPYEILHHHSKKIHHIL